MCQQIENALIKLNKVYQNLLIKYISTIYKILNT